MWGLLASMIVWAILEFIDLHHPRCKRDKVLYYKIGVFSVISFELLIFFVFLSAAPLFYADDVSINIKIGLIFGGVVVMAFGIWGTKIEYQRYKMALKTKKRDS